MVHVPCSCPSHVVMLMFSVDVLYAMYMCLGLPVYYSAEENIRIEQDSEVRIKIIGIRLAADQIVR